jgi:hypothetical protein
LHAAIQTAQINLSEVTGTKSTDPFHECQLFVACFDRDAACPLDKAQIFKLEIATQADRVFTDTETLNNVQSVIASRDKRITALTAAEFVIAVAIIEVIIVGTLE